MKQKTYKRLAVAASVFAGALLVAWPISRAWEIACEEKGLLVGISAGCIGFALDAGMMNGCTISTTPPRQYTWFIKGAGGDGGVAVALWIPALLFAIPAFFLWRAGRRPLPGHCPCGYNLTGNVSGRCPECGREVDYKDIPQQPPGPA